MPRGLRVSLTTRPPDPRGLGATDLSLLQMLCTTWGQNRRPSPLLPRSPAESLNYAPTSTGSIEAPLSRAPSSARLWKRADRISTGWRYRPVRNPLSGLSRNLEAILYAYSGVNRAVQ